MRTSQTPFKQGAVDGCHIQIVSPQQCPADYFNRKRWHSIILQGTVDDRGRLMYMLDGQVVYTMHVFFQIPACTKRGRAIPSLLTLNKRLLEKTFHSSYWVIQPTLCCMQWLMKAFPNNGKLIGGLYTVTFAHCTGCTPCRLPDISDRHAAAGSKHACT